MLLARARPTGAGDGPEPRLGSGGDPPGSLAPPTRWAPTSLAGQSHCSICSGTLCSRLYGLRDFGMPTRLRRWAWLLLAVLIAWPAAAAETTVTAVRLAPLGERVRVQLDLTQRAEFRVFLLADPYRVVIDLAQVVWRLTEAPASSADGPIAGIRYGQFQPGTGRMVLDARTPVLVIQAQLQEPQGAASGSAASGGAAGWRLILDLQ